MRGMLLVARRDFWAYVNSVWGWAILALLLLVDGVIFNFYALGKTAQYSADVLEKFFYVHGGVTLAAAAVTTMRLFAEERQTGTIVLLESSPLTEAQAVAGKYLSAMAFLTVLQALSLFMPAMIFINGKIGYGQIGVGYLGTMLMASAGVAIGTWASAISRNQILALVVGGITILFAVLCWPLSRVLDPPFKGLFAYVAFYDKHFEGFMQGRINTEGIVFFVSVSFAFLLLATRSLNARRWE